MIKFLYFDLGKVLLDFGVLQMCRQMGQVAGLDYEQVREVLFDTGLEARYELGQITEDQFYRAFCEQTNSRPDKPALVSAASDFFELNVEILPVVAQLQSAGHRMGILSNTCHSHWEHCRRRFTIVAEGFSVHALSFRIGALKPDEDIFRAAAELAQVAPEEIFFTDDVAGHVTAAQAVGFDAVQYTSARRLAGELRKRGIRFNY